MPLRPIPFDAAELAWQDYRDKTCAAFARQDQGKVPGPLYDGCRVNVTWNHLRELRGLYSYPFLEGL